MTPFNMVGGMLCRMCLWMAIGEKNHDGLVLHRPSLRCCRLSQWIDSTEQ